MGRLLRVAVSSSLLLAGAFAQTPTTTVHGILGYNWSAGTQQTQSISSPTTINIGTIAVLSALTTPQAELGLTAVSPPCSGCFSSANGDVTFAMTSATPVAGILRLTLNPQCINFPPAIDVNNDGTIELDVLGAPSSIDVPVVLADRRIEVRMNGQTVNFGGAVCQARLAAEFLPQPSALASIGTACGPTFGASLTAPQSGPGPRQLTLQMGTAGGPIGVLGVGGAPLAPVVCGPMVLPIATALVTPTPSGTTQVIPIAPALTGVYTLQYVELRNDGTLAWSNGIVATL